MRVAIIGPIGIGKSTFVNNLTNLVNDDGLDFKFINEPLSEFEDTLKKFYDDKVKWSYPIQCEVAINYEKIHVENINNDIIVDSSYSHLVYSRILHNEGYLTDQELYNVSNIARSIKYDILIILVQTADIIKSRIVSRSRDYETDLDYMNNHVNSYYSELYNVLNDDEYDVFSDATKIEIVLPDMEDTEVDISYNDILDNVATLIKEIKDIE